MEQTKSISEIPDILTWNPEDEVSTFNESQAAHILKWLYPDSAEHVHIARCIPVIDLMNRGYHGDPIYVDVVCEPESIVVQIDTVEDYRVPARILATYKKEEVLTGLGYKFIRIPFFVQINTETLRHFFGTDATLPGDKECFQMSGFYALDDYEQYNEPNPYVPASYCSLGGNKFIADLYSLPAGAFKEVTNSLKSMKERFGEEMVMIAFPEGVTCDNCPIGKEKKEMEEAWNTSVCYCNMVQ